MTFLPHQYTEAEKEYYKLLPKQNYISLMWNLRDKCFEVLSSPPKQGWYQILNLHGKI